MKTALLIADSPASQQFFAEMLGPSVNVILQPAPAEATKEKFTGLFSTWMRLVDGIVVDGVSIGESTRWAVEALQSTPLREHQPVVVRLTELQRNLACLPEEWLVLSNSETHEQTARAVSAYLLVNDAKAKLQQSDLLRSRQAVAAPSPPAAVVSNGESLRYRDALKNIAQVIGRHLDENALLVEFLQVVRELLGVGKLAIFTRGYQNDLFTDQLALAGRQLAIVGSSGIAPQVVEHLRLGLDFGMAACLAREARILRRSQVLDNLAPDHDPQIAREFELLGTEFAVPMFDEDQLLGVLTFSGKITGEALANEELELVYHLMSQLAQAIRNLHLQKKVTCQQRFMSEVLSNVQSGVVVVGQDDRILSVNRQAQALLELGAREVVGQELNRLPACVADALFEVLQTGQAIAEREVTMPRSRRSLRVNAARFAANLSEHGKSAGGLMVVALLEDLTQAKIQQAQARELADKEFFTRLASRLSHELKNSLVSIKVFGQLLPERYGDPEFRDEFGRVVVNEISRVDALVNNLTFFSHPLGLVPEAVPVEVLLDASLKSVAQEFGRKQLLQVLAQGTDGAASENVGLPLVTVKRHLDHKVPVIEADRIRLIQAFDHVLRNALQALPNGGRVTVSTADAEPADFPKGQFPPGGAVKIQWQDAGEGIELANIARVTEPFMTTRNTGVGLGLTIVKKIIERHSGRLVIDSLYGKGTTVTLVIPVRAQPHPEDALLAHLADFEQNAADNGNGHDEASLSASKGSAHGQG